jgi:hypothetical protein
MADDQADILSKHAQRRRDVLAKAAIIPPVVSLLLAQASRPKQAQAYPPAPAPAPAPGPAPG